MKKDRRTKEHKSLSKLSEEKQAIRRLKATETLKKQLGVDNSPEEVKMKLTKGRVSKEALFTPSKYSGKSAKFLATNYIDYLARQRFKTVFFNKEGGLTKEDAIEVLAEIVTPHQNKTLLEYKKTEENVRRAITNLQGTLQELRSHKAHLKGYVLLWDNVEKAELTINSILHEVKDTKERKRIAKAEKPLMLFIDSQIDKEGYISLETGYTKSRGNKQTPLLKSQIETITQAILRSKKKYLAYHEATEDYMKDKGFKVKAYSELLDHLKKSAETPAITMLVKYTGATGGAEGYDRVKELYDILPKPEEIKPDKKMKERFRRGVIRD